MALDQDGQGLTPAGVDPSELEHEAQGADASWRD